jgi:hypothetical protein
MGLKDGLSVNETAKRVSAALAEFGAKAARFRGQMPTWSADTVRRRYYKLRRRHKEKF